MKYLFYILLVPVMVFASPPEEMRRTYAEKFCKAFDLQFNGHTTLAYYAFKDAFQLALKSGESAAKLQFLESTFRWYRMYGYNCGVLPESSRCTDEYVSDAGAPRVTRYGTNFDPKQERFMRDFLFGVGELISGVLCISIGTPLSIRFGPTLIVSGSKHMWDAVNGMMEDSRERTIRLNELKQFEKIAEAVSK